MSQNLIDDYELAVRDYEHSSYDTRAEYLRNLRAARSRLSRRMAFKTWSIIALTVMLLWAVAL